MLLSVYIYTSLTYAGTVIGVLLNVIFPSWLTLALLILTLVTSIVRSSQKVLVIDTSL